MLAPEFQTIKQPDGSRLCGAACAAMATHQSLEYVISNARGGDECCSRVLWLSAYLAKKGVFLGTYASVDDWRTGERLTIERDVTELTLTIDMRRPCVLGVDSETVPGQLHWVFWDGRVVRDPNPQVADERPLSDFAGRIVDVFPLTWVIEEE